MRRPVTSIVRIAVVVALVAAIVWAVRPRAIVVETVSAVRGELTATVTAEGRTRVKDFFSITAPVEGDLERIALKAGDRVSDTTVVARIRPALPRPLDARSRAEALAVVSAARASVTRAEAAEREAIAALAHADSLMTTARTLSTAGATASKDLEHAGHEVEIRRQAVEEARAALTVARADLARAEAAAASAGHSGRGVTQVHSPSTGWVLRVVREDAGPVTAGTPLLEIGNVADLEIVADVLTTDAMSVTPGARATIYDWGGPGTLAARVRQIEPGAFTKVSALGLEEQRVPVVLDLVGEQPAGFGNAFHVKAAIAVWSGSHVLTIPSTALFRVGARWAVFVVRDGRARLTPVRVGRSDDARSVVDEGLEDGDQVVVQPSDALRDGSRVARLPSAPG